MKRLWLFLARHGVPFMHRIVIHSFLAVLLLTTAVFQAVAEPPATSPNVAPNDQQVIWDNTQFGCVLYNRLAAEPGNLFYSPLSIYTAMAIASAGARGDTLAQFPRAMHFGLPQNLLHPAIHMVTEAVGKKNDGVEIHIANRLWGQQGKPFLPEFLELIKRYYAGGFQEVDFNS